MNVIACTRCRASLPESARFCRQCGQSLDRTGTNAGKRSLFGVAAWTLVAGLVGVGSVAAVVAWTSSPPSVDAASKPSLARHLDVAAVDARANALVGEWLEEPRTPIGNGLRTRRLTLRCRADQTFEQTWELFDTASGNSVGKPWVLSGDWRVKGDVLTCNVKQTTLAGQHPQGEWVYSIRSLKPGMMTLRLDALPDGPAPEDLQDRYAHYHAVE